MADYHFVYKDVEGASTQWDDIQRKLGNLPPKPPPFKPAPFAPAEDEDSKPKDKAGSTRKPRKSLKISKMISMTIGSSKITGSESILEIQLLKNRKVEKKRLAEMREAAKIAKFGSLIPISGSDFVREVSQAPQDIWVVVCYIKMECRLLLQCLEDLAKRYPATKFVKIISTECIPNYPDRNLPTILVYNNSAIKATYVGIHSFGRRCTPESVALVLCQSDPVLNDAHGGEQSREAVLDGVRKKFVERVVREHEDDDGSSSD
ncbi:hypothetical protein Pfo_030292 [Paulownia fortunei]|nr:hypothetical protein Pfo_030292 [Paulownia fortunei]